MEAKDILRLVLFVFFFAFALRSGFRISVPRSANMNSTAESEDTKTQPLLQQLKDSRAEKKQETHGYENNLIRNELQETRRSIPDSVSTVSMIIVLLTIHF